MDPIKPKYKTGLVLSGGAVRGVAHLGVLQALLEKDISVDILSCASAGALAGAFFSQGYSPEEILKIFSRKKIWELVRISIPRSGFFKIDGLKKVLTTHLRIRRIEYLPIPMFIAVTNLQEGKVEYLSEGPLIDSLIASSSIPTLFEATHLNNSLYIDGGIMDNLPVSPIKKQCAKIIAVYANPTGKIDKIKHPAQIAERAFHLAIASDIQRKKRSVDIYIEPGKLESFAMFDLRKAKEIFRAGYEEALAVLEASE